MNRREEKTVSKDLEGKRWTNLLKNSPSTSQN